MDIKKSPECASGTHPLCDVKWIDGDGWLHMCDCDSGACHKNAEQIRQLLKEDVT